VHGDEDESEVSEDEKQIILKSLNKNELEKLKSMLAETYVKEVLSNEEKHMQLSNIMQDYPKSVKSAKPLWRSIKKIDRKLYDEAQSLQKCSEGISVTEFLSDNADILKKELARLN
jgi:ribosomal protein S8